MKRGYTTSVLTEMGCARSAVTGLRTTKPNTVRPVVLNCNLLQHSPADSQRDVLPPCGVVIGCLFRLQNRLSYQMCQLYPNGF